MPFTPPTKSPTVEDMIGGATTSRTKEIVGLAADEANKLIDEMMKRPKLKSGRQSRDDIKLLNVTYLCRTRSATRRCHRSTTWRP